MRETKIDNQGVDYKKSQTSPTLEDMDTKSNKHVSIMSFSHMIEIFFPNLQ